MVITSTASEENLMLAGKPLTWEELIADITKSEDVYNNGDFMSSKELKGDVKHWWR